MGDVYRNILNNIKTMNEIDIQRQTVASNDFVLAESLRKQNMQRELSDLLTTKPESSLSDLIPTVIKYSPLEGMKMKQDVADAEAKRQQEQATLQQNKLTLANTQYTKLLETAKEVSKNTFTNTQEGIKTYSSTMADIIDNAELLGTGKTRDQIVKEFGYTAQSAGSPELQLYMKGLEKQQGEAIENQARANQALTPKEKIDLGLQQQKMAMDANKPESSGDMQQVVLDTPSGPVTTTFNTKQGYLVDGTWRLTLPVGYTAVTKGDLGRSVATSRFLGIPVTKDQADSLDRNQKIFQVDLRNKYVGIKANLDGMLLNLKEGNQSGLAATLKENAIMYQIAISSNEPGARITEADFKNTTFGNTAKGVLENYKRYIGNTYSKATRKELEEFATVSKIIAEKAYKQQSLESVDSVLSTSGVAYGSDEYLPIRNAMFKQITKRDVVGVNPNKPNTLVKSGVKKLGVRQVPDAPKQENKKTNTNTNQLGTIRG